MAHNICMPTPWLFSPKAAHVEIFIIGFRLFMPNDFVPMRIGNANEILFIH